MKIILNRRSDPSNYIICGNYLNLKVKIILIFVAILDVKILFGSLIEVAYLKISSNLIL